MRAIGRVTLLAGVAGAALLGATPGWAQGAPAETAEQDNGDILVLANKLEESTPEELEKYGSLKYLAQWQGLRGEDLNIDLSEERSLTCSRTKMVVTFTPDRTKYFNQMAEAEA